MSTSLTKYSALFMLLLLVVALNVWGNPFNWVVDENETSNTSLAFLQDPIPVDDGKKPADRPLQSMRDFSNAMVDIAEGANPTVVTVFTERTIRQRTIDPFADFFGFGPRGGQPQQREFRQAGQGSGVIVSADGYILTNNHVISEADTVKIRMMNNQVYPATVVGADPNTDIAVLKIEGADLPSMKLGDSDELRVGEWILAIGSPLDENLAHTVTMGIVSAKGRSGVGLLDYEDFIQTDAAINPGNSGGALINLDGELVGINTAIASRSGGFQGIGFAIPVNLARNIMRSIIETGKVTRSYIGIAPQNIDANIARAFNLKTPEGVLVASVVEDSPADIAGLKEGDVIREADGRKMANTAQFRGYIAAQAPGDDIRLSILRDNEEINITVKVTEMSQDEVIARAGSRGLWERTGFAVIDLTNAKLQELGLRSGVRGVIVDEISEESAAFANNLRKDDIITAVNRRPVRSIEEFNQLVSSVESGQVVLLQVLRGRTSSFVAFEIN
ncbi:MAG TPA: protease [Bacteroidetes bacterium]|nr:protease [Bacteroidota bacterium]